MTSRTAIHEAGHLIAAHVLGLPLPHTVTALGDEGRTVTALAELPLTLDGLRDEIVALLAGEAALAEFGDPRPGDGASRDRALARGLAEGIHPGAEVGVISVAEERAKTLVHEHRDPLARLAEGIERDSRWFGDEVSNALRAAAGGVPVPPLGSAGLADIAMRRRVAFETAAQPADDEATLAAKWDRALDTALGIPEAPQPSDSEAQDERVAAAFAQYEASIHERYAALGAASRAWAILTVEPVA